MSNLSLSTLVSRGALPASSGELVLDVATYRKFCCWVALTAPADKERGGSRSAALDCPICRQELGSRVDGS